MILPTDSLLDEIDSVPGTISLWAGKEKESLDV